MLSLWFAGQYLWLRTCPLFTLFFYDYISGSNKSFFCDAFLENVKVFFCGKFPSHKIVLSTLHLPFNKKPTRQLNPSSWLLLLNIFSLLNLLNFFRLINKSYCWDTHIFGPINLQSTCICIGKWRLNVILLSCVQI